VCHFLEQCSRRPSYFEKTIRKISCLAPGKLNRNLQKRFEHKTTDLDKGQLSCALLCHKSCNKGFFCIYAWRVTRQLKIFPEFYGTKLLCHLSHNSPQIFCILNEVRQRTLFLGAFPKLRKVAVSFVLSVCPSVRVEQLGSHWTDFQEILRVFFANLSRKFKFH